MSDTADKVPEWHIKAIVISIAVSTIGYLLFSLLAGWKDVLSAFLMIGISGTLLALALSVLNYGLRFYRWAIYLSRLGYKVPLADNVRIYLSGFALTTTPGKAGEAFRSVLLRRHDVPVTSSIAAFVTERLSDLLAVVLLALIGLSQYPEARGAVLFGLVGVVVTLILISREQPILYIRQWAERKSGRIYKLVAQTGLMLEQARSCHSLGLVIFTTAISVIAWAAEAFALYLILLWMGTDVSLSFAIFTYSLSMLAGALSFLPGGLGGAEVVMVSLLVSQGLDVSVAMAATVFIRLTTLWFAVIIGLLALLRGNGATRRKSYG